MFNSFGVFFISNQMITALKQLYTSLYTRSIQGGEKLYTISILCRAFGSFCVAKCTNPLRVS